MQRRARPPIARPAMTGVVKILGLEEDEEEEEDKVEDGDGGEVTFGVEVVVMTEPLTVKVEATGVKVP